MEPRKQSHLRLVDPVADDGVAESTECEDPGAGRRRSAAHPAGSARRLLHLPASEHPWRDASGA